MFDELSHTKSIDEMDTGTICLHDIWVKCILMKFHGNAWQWSIFLPMEICMYEIECIFYDLIHLLENVGYWTFWEPQHKSPIHDTVCMYTYICPNRRFFYQQSNGSFAGFVPEMVPR